MQFSSFSAGGGNIPALNDLLSVFDVAFGDALLEGQLTVADEKIYFASGVNIARFPAGGYLHAAQLADKATVGAHILGGPHSSSWQLFGVGTGSINA